MLTKQRIGILTVSYQKIQKVGDTSIFQKLLKGLIICLLAYSFLSWFDALFKHLQVSFQMEIYLILMIY